MVGDLNIISNYNRNLKSLLTLVSWGHRMTCFNCSPPLFSLYMYTELEHIKITCSCATIITMNGAKKLIVKLYEPNAAWAPRLDSQLSSNLHIHLLHTKVVGVNLSCIYFVSRTPSKNPGFGVELGLDVIKYEMTRTQTMISTMERCTKTSLVLDRRGGTRRSTMATSKLPAIPTTQIMQ